MEKDELKALQKRYHGKVTSQQPLHPDAGGLGKNRHGYEEKRRAGHGLHSPRGGMAETRSQYAKKQVRRDHGTS